MRQDLTVTMNLLCQTWQAFTQGVSCLSLPGSWDLRAHHQALLLNYMLSLGGRGMDSSLPFVHLLEVSSGLDAPGLIGPCSGQEAWSTQPSNSACTLTPTRRGKKQGREVLASSTARKHMQDQQFFFKYRKASARRQRLRRGPSCLHSSVKAPECPP